MKLFDRYITRPPGMWEPEDVREVLADPTISEKECKEIIREVLRSKKTFNCILKQIEQVKR